MSSFQSYSATSLSAPQTVENFNAVRSGHILPKAGTNLSETNGAHNIGSATYKWDKACWNGFASSVTVSAPVTFTAQATFNTSTTITLAGLPAMCVAKYIVPIGSAPQSGSSTAEILNFNTLTTNTIAGATLTTNQISLPSGAYVFNAWATFRSGFMNIESSFYLFDATASITVFNCGGPQTHLTATVVSVDMIMTGSFSLATQSSLEMRVAHSGALDVFFGPDPANDIWNDGFNKNLYQQIVFFKVS